MSQPTPSAVELVPGNSLITTSAEEGRALAITIARRTVKATQPDVDVLKEGRPTYATNPDGLIAVTHVVATEFQTIAAANDYWK